MGSGTRNILRYAPLYYPDYKVEINSGSQFIFSITYMAMSQENEELSQETGENVPRNKDLSQEVVVDARQMSQENATGPDDEDFNLLLGETSSGKAAVKKRKRQQGIIGLIKRNPSITMEEMAESLDVNERTIKRDIEELKNIIEHTGPTKGGSWRIIKK